MRLRHSIPKMPTHARPLRQGFTLPELVVVVLLVALVSSLALPAITKGWEGVMYSRIGNTLLIVINGVRQQAITSEQDTLIEFKDNRWCARFADADEHSCGLGSDRLPLNFKFYPRGREEARFLYTAGRGFSPLSSATIAVGNYNTHASSAYIALYNSSLGRVRVCANIPTVDLPRC